MPEAPQPRPIRLIRRGEPVDGLRAITLVDETSDTPAVRYTQHDVRAVQLAKSAIRTGVKMLAAEAGMVHLVHGEAA